MRTFFKITSIIGLILTSVIFGFVFYGEKLIPNTIHLIEGEEIRLGGLYSLRASQSKDVLSAESQNTSSSFNSDKVYSVRVSVLKAIPVKSADVRVSRRKYVTPVGDVFGLRLFTKGVLVVGLDDVYAISGPVSPARAAGIEVGDIILSVEGRSISRVCEISQILRARENKAVRIRFSRRGKPAETELLPARSERDGQYRAGLWLRDSTAGVGTITYYDSGSGAFGSLGHAVCDVDTGMVMPLRDGDAVETVVSGCYRGGSGVTGELCGIFREKTIGRLEKNTLTGVYGYLDNYRCREKQIPVATRQEVRLGEAEIISTVDGNGPRRYRVKIVRIFRSGGESSKNMVIEITDPALIAKTGGIVQGMSGSPILQGGMLVGAVTHVFVNDPLQGYGIFADTMLQSSDALREPALGKAS